MAFRHRDERPCRYVAGLIERHLVEINEGMRELRAVKQELGQLRARMRAEGIVERDGSYCHYIETAAAESASAGPSDDGLAHQRVISAG